MWRKPHPRANKLATAAGCTPALNSASNNALNHASNQGLSQIIRARKAINKIAFSLTVQKHCALINWSLTPINLIKKPHALLEHGAFGASTSNYQAIKRVCTLRCSPACVALNNEVGCNKRLRCTEVSNTDDANTDQRVTNRAKCAGFCNL